MTYATVMVSLVLGRSNARLLEIAVRFAAKFDAGVIGLAAWRPIESVCRDYAVPAALFEEDRKQIARHVAAGELEFRHAVSALKEWTEWRAHMTVLPLAENLWRQARRADLIVLGTGAADDQLDATRHPDIRDFVLRVGRPVLVVPDKGIVGAFDRVLVAWKDTREAQRAIVDALPLLKAASKVTVVEIADEQELADARTGLAEVVSWLGHHGITADPKVAVPSRANASQLDAIARELKADVIVAGAYGYSRQGKWVLGGITSELLAGDRCAIVAH